MSICASCGRRVDHFEVLGFGVSVMHLARGAPRDTGVHGGRAARAAQRGHGGAATLSSRSSRANSSTHKSMELQSVARGNTRVYEAEVTRLANRFVEKLEARWQP